MTHRSPRGRWHRATSSPCASSSALPPRGRSRRLDRGHARDGDGEPVPRAWLAEAPRIFARDDDGPRAKDFAAVGELAEASALAMHASAIAAGLVYWTGATLEALAAVRALRARGTPAFATIDAGPHVKVLCRPEDAALAGTWMRAVPGVLRVIEARRARAPTWFASRRRRREGRSRRASSSSRGLRRPRGGAGARRRGRPVRGRRHVHALPLCVARDPRRDRRRARPGARSALAPPGRTRSSASGRAPRRWSRRWGRARRTAGRTSRDPRVRKAIFLAARRAHAEAQGGGSGVDIAASTYGGALRYGMVPADDPLTTRVDLPAGLVLGVFWCGRSARTSELSRRVTGLAEKDRDAFARCIDAHRRVRPGGARGLSQPRDADRSSPPGKRTPARSPRSGAPPTRRSSRPHSRSSPSSPSARRRRFIRPGRAAATSPSGSASAPPSSDFLPTRDRAGMLPLDLRHRSRGRATNGGD